MASEKFRLYYADLMKQYQFVEKRLEQLYAAISGVSGKAYLDRLGDVDKSPLPSIIKAIQKLEKERNISVFTEEECDALFALIKRRNFWAHECFTSLKFDEQTGKLKNPEDMHRMAKDLRDAEEWHEKLFNKQRQY